MAAAPSGGGGLGTFFDSIKSPLHAAGGLLSGIGQKKAANEYAKLYNQWLGQRASTVSGIQSGMASNPAFAAAGISNTPEGGYDILGPQKQSTQQSTSGTSSSHAVQQVDPTWKNKEDIEGMRRLTAQEAAQAEHPEGLVATQASATMGAAKNQANKLIGALARQGINPGSVQSMVATQPGMREATQSVNEARTQIPLQLTDRARAASESLAGMTRGQRTVSDQTQQFSQMMNMLQTLPPDFLKALQFMMPPTPQSGSAGMGFNAAGQGLSSF